MSAQAPVLTESIVKCDKPNHGSEDSIRCFNTTDELLWPVVLDGGHLILP